MGVHNETLINVTKKKIVYKIRLKLAKYGHCACTNTKERAYAAFFIGGGIQVLK